MRRLHLSLLYVGHCCIIKRPSSFVLLTMILKEYRADLLIHDYTNKWYPQFSLVSAKIWLR